MNFITGILSIITLTSLPLIAIVGVITDPEYRNVPIFLFLIFCFYIGGRTWMILHQDHIRKR
jgi:hypothetical protein